MAKVPVPAQTPTTVYAGGAVSVVIANGGSSPMSLGPTDPSVDGATVQLQSGDSLFMSAGGDFAASQWVAYSNMGSEAVISAF